MADPKEVLHTRLQDGRDAVLLKLDGLSDYDTRRPMTPTATNLLGLAKHLAGVEVGYFGDTFGRPFDGPLPWPWDETRPNDDMYASADQSREFIVDLYRRACAHADVTIETLDLGTVGRVPWWPADKAEAPLHQILVHMIAETHRHAGQMDILREMIDGSVGCRAVGESMPSDEEQWWAAYRAQVEAAAGPPPAP